MKLEIKDKKENKLLGRLEVEGKLTFEGATPSNEVLRDKLAAELNADKSLIIVKHIYSKFSYQEADFLAYIYSSKEKMDKMEVVTKHLKKKLKERRKLLRRRRKRSLLKRGKKKSQKKKMPLKKRSQ